MITLNFAGKLNDWRFERKFRADFQSFEHIISMLKLHPAMFSEVYPERRVSNIYMDTVDKNHYFLNEIGASERVKVRVRWYRDFFDHINNPVLEFKIKKNMLGSKLRYDLAPFTIDKDFNSKTLAGVFQGSGLPDFVMESLKPLEPTLFNRYIRRYFVSADWKYRITIDFDMEFCEAGPFPKAFFTRGLHMNDIVLELKYAEDADCGAGEIAKIFSYRLERNSKYQNGLDATFFY
jgi:hypothetical protein